MLHNMYKLHKTFMRQFKKWYQGVLDTFKNESKIADQYREKILSALQEKATISQLLILNLLKIFYRLVPILKVAY